jgi:hypothetical protein
MPRHLAGLFIVKRESNAHSEGFAEIFINS